MTRAIKALPRPILTAAGLALLMGFIMAFGKTLVLCSPLHGRLVTEDGKPAAGVRIERHWTWGWNDKQGTDSTATDDQGAFELPIVEGTSFWGSMMPHEPDIKQRIVAHGPNGEVEIWYASKKTYELNSEMEGRPVKVICRIDKEPSSDGLYWGTCTEDAT